MTLLKKSALLLSFTLMSACSTQPVTPLPKPEQSVTRSEVGSPSAALKLATWNMEHLAYPANLGCKPRDSETIKAMQAYAKKIDADIFALQEVASKEALATIFPEQDWQLLVSERPDSKSYVCRESGFDSTQQKVAFAIKKSVSVKKISHLKALALDNPGLRYGLVVTVDSAQGKMDVLNIHMKSGCFTDDFMSQDSPACQTYAKQAQVLDSWIASQENTAHPYVILGDFNHRISAPYNRLTRTLVSPRSDLTIATRELIGCHPRYPAPIDHILVGGTKTTSASLVSEVHPYQNMNTDAMLSDHCAVSVVLSADTKQLSTAVRWQTLSKEYRALTETTYQRATEALATATPVANWVVVMDVDETVLDNSAYQKESELSGRGYSTKSWADWVKREEAGLVPGAREFIQNVFAAGGKLALITNRNRTLDAHTWRNLTTLGVPVTAQNTCLTGRTDADKRAVNLPGIVNDKDLRRQQISQGTAQCFAPAGVALQEWSQPQVIFLQVGDNIEDFAGITQENADIEQLLPELGKQLFLLPNPMYGSW